MRFRKKVANRLSIGFKTAASHRHRVMSENSIAVKPRVVDGRGTLCQR